MKQTLNLWTTTLILLTLLFSCSGDKKANYQYIHVDAPFEMDSIKLFVFPEKDFPITAYGAVEGGTVDNTQAIADAIEACNKAGGGRVVIPNGEWFTGPIHLKSNVNLHLEDDAVVKFSDKPADYLPAVQTTLEGMELFNYSPLIYAWECENIAITGKGTLKPNMDTWKIWFPREKPYMDAAARLYTMMSTGVAVEERQFADEGNRIRPYMIHLNRCKNVYLDGFKIRESPFWCVHLFKCDGGVVRNLDLKAHGHNNDGIDLEMTRNFLVEDCTFDQGDDAVVLKSGSNQDAWRLNQPTENIVVRNCTVLKGHTMLGLGSELSGGIRNIYLHDCSAPKSVMRFVYIKTNHRRGGDIENIYVKNVSSGKTNRVFEIDTDVLYQWRDFPTYETRITKIDNINLSNVTCNSAEAIYEIKGDERRPVGTVKLTDIQVDTVKSFVKKVIHAENVIENDVKYTVLNATK